MLRLAVLVSGFGSNLQALIDAKQDLYEIGLVVSSSSNAYAIERALQAGIKVHVLEASEFSSQESWSLACLDLLAEARIDLIVLAGFLRKIDQHLLSAYPDSIINIHPSLLPLFGGKGVYGLRPHELALQAGAKRTGATVHLIDCEYDRGTNIIQESLEILPSDTALSLQKRVLEQIEHRIIVEAVKIIARERSENEEKSIN